MFYDLVEKGPIKQMLIGPAFARATRAVAELTTRFKLPQVILHSFLMTTTPIIKGPLHC